MPNVQKYSTFVFLIALTACLIARQLVHYLGPSEQTLVCVWYADGFT